ncbi:MAG: carbamoyltransferase HypF [Bacteroidota bacterium]
MERWRLLITGLVQGVGFRPFLYSLARKNNLKGWVRNNSSGVELEVEGTTDDLRLFLNEIETQPPSAARVDTIHTSVVPLRQTEVDFRIIPSKAGEISGSPLPDQGICPDCLREFYDENDRRYRHTFNSCTICGPRFTIIEDLPFDRERTTMAGYRLCERCQAEYSDYTDRRFHAQTIACPQCGPVLWLADSQGQRLAEDPQRGASRILKSGGILGIKGIGGYHLTVNAFSETAVGRLRRLKDRDRRPFAVLFRDLEALKEHCLVSAAEERLLLDPVRPIVLLSRKQGSPLAGDVNPGLREIGAFLPYTGIQLLLFDESLTALVMTSGNRSGEPLTIDNAVAFETLGPMVDGFLVHDRKIYWRCDDSVVKVQKEHTIGIRRSRGYVPAPIKVGRALVPLLACGAQQKNTFALTKEDRVYLSAHQGDLDNFTAYLSYRETIARFQRLLGCEPHYAVHDLHPDYNSTNYALGSGLKTVGVQHHLAHLGSVIANQQIKGTIIGVALDGSGYGTDGKIWGGEFFTGAECCWERKGQLKYYPLPGGEAAIREPWRMAAAYLDMAAPEYLEDWLAQNGLSLKWPVLRMAIKQGINAPETSSMGRFFDAAAAVTGNIKEVSYEGEAAVWFEHQADLGFSGAYQFKVSTVGDKLEIDPGLILKQVCQDLGRLSAGAISAKFHRTIAALITEVCLRLRIEARTDQVALSGGVFQNRFLLDLTWESLERQGFKVFVPEVVPMNDGGIALGQAWFGSLMIERGIDDVFSSAR